jgi:hypothetical protein
MGYPTFDPISDMTLLQPRDYDLSDPTILDPYAANPLLGGEWLRVILSNGTQVLERPVGGGTESNPLVGPFWGETGNYNIQGTKRLPILLFAPFEAHTTVCDTTGLTTAGQKLMVTDVTIGGLQRRGVKLAAGGAGVLVVAYYEGPGRRVGEIRIKGLVDKTYLTS